MKLPRFFRRIKRRGNVAILTWRAGQWFVVVDRSTDCDEELGLVVDTLAPSVAVADVRQPAGRILETALRLAGARTAVPAVDTDARRPVADVESTAAVAVRVARVAKAHVIRQPRPRISPVNRQLQSSYSRCGFKRETDHIDRHAVRFLLQFKDQHSR